MFLHVIYVLINKVNIRICLIRFLIVREPLTAMLIDVIVLYGIIFLIILNCHNITLTLIQIKLQLVASLLVNKVLNNKTKWRF